MLIFTLAGCGIPGCEESSERDLDYGEGNGLDVESVIYGLYQLFAATGHRIEIGPEVEKPYFDVPARGLKINGSPVYCVAFTESKETDEFVATIAKDGRMIGEKKVEEEKTPHFFREGKVVALYLGDKQSTIEILEEVMGKQIAGGESPVGEGEKE